MTLSEIEKLTKKLSEARAELSGIISRLQLKQNEALHHAMPDIRRLVGKTADSSGEIYFGVQVSPELFIKPKSQCLNGIQFGYRKGVGGIVWEDEQESIKLAEKRVRDGKMTQEQFDLIIKTERTIRKKALGNLPAADIKALACTVEETGDIAFVRPVDGAVDKLVTKILKTAIAEAQKEAA